MIEGSGSVPLTNGSGYRYKISINSPSEIRRFIFFYSFKKEEADLQICQIRICRLIMGLAFFTASKRRSSIIFLQLSIFCCRYPYCYGYWKKFADFEKRNGTPERVMEVFNAGTEVGFIYFPVLLLIFILNCFSLYVFALQF
jgi:hypothetical protein